MASSWPKSLLLFSFFNVKKQINKGLQRNKQLEYFNLKILVFEILKPFWSMSSTRISEAHFCALPCPKHAWEHHCCQDPVSDHTLYFRCQTSMREFLYVVALQKKKKEKPMLWFQINQFVTGQIPALQAPTCILAFHQHPFYPQNKATSGCLAAKWHCCLQQGLVQALGVPQDHHAGHADCPGVLCHLWAGTVRMCLSKHNTLTHGSTALLRMLVPVLHVTGLLLHSNAPFSLQGKADCL